MTDPDPELERLRDRAIELGIPDAEFGTTAELTSAIERLGVDSSRPCVADGVRLLSAADIRPEPIAWQWEGWLARGKLHVIAGAPGTGKTTIALALAATVTSGGRWPDTSRARPDNVLIWSGEDDPSDTLLPRLLAMGANRNRVFFVDGVVAEDGVRSFDPAHDMPDLVIAAHRIGDIGLMIVDPIVNAVTGDSHKNTETRRALQPVVDLAEKLDAAVLGVSHYTKGTQGRDPIERVTGSIAFGALPRIIMGAAKSSDDDGPERLLVRAKSNIGPDGGGFGYELRQSELPDYPGIVASGILWGDPLEGTARDLLNVAEGTEDRSELDEVADWLTDVLSDGRIQTTELQKLAKQAGYSWRTVQRAKSKIGAGTERVGFGRDGKFYWHIERQKSPQELAAYGKGPEPSANTSFQRHENGPSLHRAPSANGGTNGALCDNTAGSDRAGTLSDPVIGGAV